MALTLRGEALFERREAEDNERWLRSWAYRGWKSPITGAKPESFEIEPGLFRIGRTWEFLCLPCTRCKFLDNFASWDKRLSVAGPGHRELNRWLCQRCAGEFEQWRTEDKTKHVHITAWLDLPDDTLNAWRLRRATNAPCVSNQGLRHNAAA